MLDVEGLLDRRPGDPHQVAGEHGVLRQVTAVLLPRGHHQRRTRPAGVEEADHAVGEPGGDVQADEGRAAGGPGVSVGHRDDGGFLNPEDVLEVGSRRDRLDERKFRRARVAEDPGHAFVAQHLQHRVDRLHEPLPVRRSRDVPALNRSTLSMTSALYSRSACSSANSAA